MCVRVFLERVGESIDILLRLVVPVPKVPATAPRDDAVLWPAAGSPHRIRHSHVFGHLYTSNYEFFRRFLFGYSDPFLNDNGTFFAGAEVFLHSVYVLESLSLA